MTAFVARRCAGALLTIFVVSLATFVIFAVIPRGDPAVRLAGRTANLATREQVRHDYGLDDSEPAQYIRLMGKVVAGDVTSYANQTNVWREIRRGVPATASLVVGGLLLALAVGCLFGIAGARWAGRWPDGVLAFVGLVGISIPAFWLGAMLLYYLTFRIQLFPAGGYVGITEDPLRWLAHMILPWCTIAAMSIGVYARVLRTSILEAEHEDHVQTARAKGLTEGGVLRHILRGALIPLVTVAGLDFAAAIGGGAILVESVFGLQGVGQYAADSIGALDTPAVMATTLYAACFIVACSAFVDIVVAWLDPRSRQPG
jgi:peptide/nickel transport system permease protein